MWKGTMEKEYEEPPQQAAAEGSGRGASPQGMAPTSWRMRCSQARGVAECEDEETAESEAAVYQAGAETLTRAFAYSRAERGTWVWTEERKEESCGEMLRGGRAPR